jgi:hypothetical protein
VSGADARVRMPGACGVVAGCPVDTWIASSTAVLVGTGVAVSGTDAGIRMPGACGVVAGRPVNTWIASSTGVLVGTGAAVSGSDAGIRMPGACGVVAGCPVNTWIASSTAVVVGTGAAVSGANPETDLAADGFAIVSADTAGSLVDCTGVWAASCSWLTEALELVELIKLEEVLKLGAVSKVELVLKPEDVLKDDGAPKGRALKGLPITSAFVGVAVVAGPVAVVAAGVALSTGRPEITVAVSNPVVPPSSWLESSEYRVDAVGAGFAEAADGVAGCEELAAVWLGVNNDATSLGSAGESDWGAGASLSALTPLSGAALSTDCDTIATC